MHATRRSLLAAADNLAAKQPERVKQMRSAVEKWAGRR
jgi:hypothetical protein